MKWTYLIQQKLKMASLLLAVMLIIVLTNTLTRKNMGHVNRSFTSIYTDRLVPATDIFRLTEQLYTKVFLLEKLLQPGADVPSLKSELEKHNRSIADLISKYEKTYLVEQESKMLSAFRQKAGQYTETEKAIINLSERGFHAAAYSLYESKGRHEHRYLVGQLARLTEIQSEVGRQLVKETEGSIASADLLSAVQMAVVIILGMVIMALVFASKSISRPGGNFTLN